MTARVGYVIPDLAVGGLQAMVVRLLRALDRDAYRPTVYTIDAGGPFERDLAELDVPYVHLPRGEGVNPAHAKAMARRFADDGIELVHCHNITSLFHGARAAWRAGRLPVLFTEHDREMPSPWKHRVLHRWLARRVTRTVAVSTRLRDELVRFEGFPPARTSALVNGVPDPAPGAPADRAAARAELGWDDAPVALAVGSLTPVKNHEALLAAGVPLRRAVPDARIVLAGDGPRREELGALAAELGIADAVTFLGVRDDVPLLLRAADVFVLPSHREGLPLSLVEAHAMSCPSVAFDVGGNPEVLAHGETGLLAPAGDVPALAEALAALLTDAERHGRLAAAARARYVDLFTHDRMVDAYVDLYRQLLGA